MHKEVKKHIMTETELFWLSYQTCQWWNATIIQSERFFDVLYKKHGGTPWNNEYANSMFVAERMYLIMSVYHSIENLQKIDIELQRKNDFSMKNVLQEIEKVASFDDIKNLRDMNEHHLDYLVKKGRKQDELLSKIKNDDEEFQRSALWTHINHDEDTVYIGKVNIKQLLIAMKEKLPIVRDKTKEIFDNGLWGKTK